MRRTNICMVSKIKDCKHILVTKRDGALWVHRWGSFSHFDAKYDPIPCYFVSRKQGNSECSISVSCLPSFINTKKKFK